MKSRETPTTPDRQPKILIIGYGNPLRGDDGLGWDAARQLMRQSAGSDVQVVTCHQLTPELAEPLSRAALAIFIDAAQDAPPGNVAVRELSPASLSLRGISHDLDPAALLGAAQLFYGIAPPAHLFTVGGQCWDLREGLSPIVRGALDNLIEQIESLIAAYKKKRSERQVAHA